MITADEQLLKTDARGRVRTPPARKESLLDEFERSGLSGKKFAAVVGVKYQTFATWAQKRRRQRGATVKPPAKNPTRPVDPVRWLEAVVEQKKLPAGSAQGVLIVHLPGGARMEIADAFQAALAAHVIRSLESKPELAC